MNEKLEREGKEFAEFMEAMPEDMRRELSKAQKQEIEAEYQNFKSSFDLGNCYLCGDSLASFHEQKPCAHWLLNPAGFRKRHFPKVTEKYGFHQLQSFLRWIANQDGFARNINDLSDEGTGKLREVTIRYKDIEWSFSCTQSDFLGHGNGSHQSPHYHFQMRQGSRIVIRYNDFHVLFSEQDVHEIAAEIAKPNLKRRWTHGEGMQDVFQPELIEKMLDAGGFVSSGEGEGDIKFDHFIVADEGTSMKGEDIAALFEEAKARGVSVGTLLKEGRLPNVKVQTIVTPGPGVVEQKARSGRGGPKPHE